MRGMTVELYTVYDYYDISPLVPIRRPKQLRAYREMRKFRIMKQIEIFAWYLSIFFELFIWKTYARHWGELSLFSLLNTSFLSGILFYINLQ